MSFKINDYNAFLSSLCDKDTENSGTSEKQVKEEPTPVIPLDFDFGLSPGNAMSDMGKRSGSAGPSSGAQQTSDVVDEVLQGVKNENMYINDIKEPHTVEADFLWPSQFGDKFDVSNYNMDIEQQWHSEPMQTSSDQEQDSGGEKRKDAPQVVLPKKRRPQPGLCSYISQQRRRAAESKTESSTDLHARTQAHKSKSPHNVIEQRYRDNINDKFVALQNSVPTLRAVARKKNRLSLSVDRQQQPVPEKSQPKEIYIHDYSSSDGEMEEDLQGLEPARKLNKGTILTKSIEYIKFLELKNNQMKQENDDLMIKANMLGLVLSESSGPNSPDFGSV